MRITLAIVLLLLLAVPASAKQAVGARICGTDGCDELGAMEDHGTPLGTRAGPPRAGEQFLRLSVSYRAGDRTVVADYRFFPASGVLTGDGASWSRPTALEALRRAARGLTPYGGESAVATSARRSAPDGGDDGDGWLVALAAVPLAAGALAVIRRRRHRQPARAPAT